MWLLLGLITVFAILSTGMKSYLVMHLPLGPWIGPLFEVISLVLLIPIISKKWFQEHAIITIAAASISGMVGLSLGMTLPSFYFLHHAEFMQWLKEPLWFMGAISLLVLCAGILSFWIAYLMKDHLIFDVKLPFPMSKLIYDMVSVQHFSYMHKLIWIGVAISSAWNGMLVWIQTSLAFHPISFIHLYMIPTLMSIGFFVELTTTMSLLIGLIYRVFAVEFLHKHYFRYMHTQEFLVTFALGMLFAHILRSVFSVGLHKTWKKDSKRAKIATMARFSSFFHDKLFLTKIVVSIFCCAIILHVFGINVAVQSVVLSATIVVGFNVARIIGEVGVIDIDNFVWCILLPVMYIFATMSSKILLLLAMFVCLCLGMVVDLIFSYKLASLAHIPYRRILNYQALGLLIAVISSGMFMWKQGQYFDLQSLQTFAFNAQTFDHLIQFKTFNYQIFIFGIIAGLLAMFAHQELLVVVSALLMAPFILIGFILAGFLAYFIGNKEKLFPLWLGVYAAHAAWMMIWAIL